MKDPDSSKYSLQQISKDVNRSSPQFHRRRCSLSLYRSQSCREFPLSLWQKSPGIRCSKATPLQCWGVRTFLGPCRMKNAFSRQIKGDRNLPRFLFLSHFGTWSNTLRFSISMQPSDPGQSPLSPAVSPSMSGSMTNVWIWNRASLKRGHIYDTL